MQGQIDSWAAKIRSQNSADFSQFNSPENWSFLQPIIEKAYDSSVANAEAILDFTRQLSSIEAGGEALSALHDTMSKHAHLDSSELMMLAYRLKEYFDHPDFALQTYAKITNTAKLNSLKDKLPQAVAQLYWAAGDTVTIKNAYYKEYLYADIKVFWTSTRQALTWRAGTHGGNADWKIVPVKDSKGKHFTIMNVEYEQYLFPKPEKTTDEFFVHCRSAGNLESDAYWILKPRANAGDFAIKSRHLNRYLWVHTNGNSANNRVVLAYPTRDDICYWKIDKN